MGAFMDYLGLAQLKTEGEPVIYDPGHTHGYDFQEIALGFTIMKEHIAANLFNAEFTLATPHIWIPKPVELVATAAAVAIIKNPLVTRRFWQGWGK